MKNNFLVTVLFVLFTASAFGQYFSSPVEVFSRKKPAYITLKSGEELVGNLKNYKLKRGLIEEITLELDKKGKTKYTPDQIAFMYLPQSGLDKMGKAMDKIYDATQWESEDINADYMRDGYAYFEQATVQLKKKKIEALLQMVNVSFNNPVKVFHDPWASETASASVGGIKVAGGIEKSYWVKVGDDVCIKLKKKNYPEDLDKVFAKCEEYKSEVPAKPSWADFPELLFNYAKSCK